MKQSMRYLVLLTCVAGCRAIPTAADFRSDVAAAVAGDDAAAIVDAADADGGAGDTALADGTSNPVAAEVTIDVADVPDGGVPIGDVDTPADDAVDAAAWTDVIADVTADAVEVSDVPVAFDAGDVQSGTDAAQSDVSADTVEDVSALGSDVVAQSDSVADTEPDATPDVPLAPCAGKNCDDGNVCTDDSCAGGACQHVNNIVTCDDGNACSTNDKCAQGVCVAGANICMCQADADCADGNLCTIDTCANTTCKYNNATGACDDGSACTTGDVCMGGTCMGTLVDADGDSYAPTSCGGSDCNDASPAMHPGASEVCTNTLDDDCNGQTDEVCAPGCGNGTCGGDETVKSCPSDCSYLLNRFAGPCNTPGTQDVCPHGFYCVARSAAGDGNVCVADFATWAPLADAHPVGDFTDATDYVIDNKTGLWWAKTPLASQSSSAALTACTPQTYGGKNDWRLPTVVELMSFADRAKQGPAYGGPSGVSFPTGDQSYITNITSGALYVRVVDFADGTSSYALMPSYRIRCVRAENTTSGSEANRFALQDGNTTVRDRISGLHWQKGSSGSTMTWASAKAWCSNDTPALPGSGWRLPTLDELHQLADRQESPAIDSVFPTPGGYFWSSTPAVLNGYAWGVHFDDGTASYGATGGLSSVRCVRDPSSCDDGNACTDDSSVSGACQHVNNSAACDDGNTCTVGDSCAAGTCKGSNVSVCGNGACECGETFTVCPTDCPKPVGMALVTAGTFWMGCNAVKDNQCGTDESPQHKVTLAAFFMDQFETTVAQYKSCVDAGVCTVPGTLAPNNNATYPSLMDRPVNFVSYVQSQQFCQWRGAGFDLPTEAQWEMAARGSCEENGSQANDPGCASLMRVYPWGDATATCSFAVMADATSSGCGTNALSAGGTKPAGDSPYGIKDLAGNVREWTRDWYSSNYYTSSPASDPQSTTNATNRGYRGGSFIGTSDTQRASYRSSNQPAYTFGNLGFRCVRPVDLCAGVVCPVVACASNTCDPGTGKCVAPQLADGTGCADGSVCLVGAKCSGGVCVGTLNCDDGNVCTDDSCVAKSGVATCQHVLSKKPCDDGNFCTTGDACGPFLALCGGQPANESGACDDGLACSVGDVCSSGQCNGTPNCDDGNVCTDDACAATGLCQHTPNAGPCSDGNACTQDACKAGTCVGAPLDADGDGYVAGTCGGNDCNDANKFVHPGAAEVCDNVDNDCNGQTDENLVTSTYFQDGDGDGYGSLMAPKDACAQPTGYVTSNSDCNDANTIVHPGAVEYCNTLDDNCNGVTDESCTSACVQSTLQDFTASKGGHGWTLGSGWLDGGSNGFWGGAGFHLLYGNDPGNGYKSGGSTASKSFAIPAGAKFILVTVPAFWNIYLDPDAADYTIKLTAGLVGTSPVTLGPFAASQYAAGGKTLKLAVDPVTWGTKQTVALTISNAKASNSMNGGIAISKIEATCN